MDNDQANEIAQISRQTSRIRKASIQDENSEMIFDPEK